MRFPQMSGGGMPRDSVAVAHSRAKEQRRRAQLWQGGMVEDDGTEDELYNVEPMNSSGEPGTRHRRTDRGNMPEEGFGSRVGYACGGKVGMAEGGVVQDDEEEEDEEAPLKRSIPSPFGEPGSEGGQLRRESLMSALKRRRGGV